MLIAQCVTVPFKAQELMRSKKVKSNCIQNTIMASFYCPQVEFPSLASVPYPSWINAVIFILAGIPSLAVPLFALCRFFFVCCKKKISAGDKMRQISWSDKNSENYKMLFSFLCSKWISIYSYSLFWCKSRHKFVMHSIEL